MCVSDPVQSVLLFNTLDTSAWVIFSPVKNLVLMSFYLYEWVRGSAGEKKNPPNTIREKTLKRNQTLKKTLPHAGDGRERDYK